MAKKKEKLVHLDALGRTLKVGDPVACPDSTTSLFIGEIISLGDRQIRVVKYGSPKTKKEKRWKHIGPGPEDFGYVTIEVPSGKLRFAEQVVLLDGQDITMYLLKLK
ncbi:MAG TPA: hypothetical protein VFM18_17035 [Methanosarcina sp.]|nr:hypothetical protein [Methanosarcina sp.]